MSSQKLSSLKEKAASARAVLRPYQVGVVNRMIRDRRHLNYMDMGMGKGLCTLLAVVELEAFPCVIVASKSAMYVLEEELRKWFDEEAIIYGGKPKQRDELFRRFATEGRRFIITNYSLSEELGTRFGIVQGGNSKGSKTSGTQQQKILPPTGTKWKVGALVADEIQLGGLFNHKTKAYATFKQLAKEIPNVFLLTGTPYRRGVVDFYGPLSLVDNEEFKSYWQFVGRYCRTIDTGFGKSIERTPKDVALFRRVINHYCSVLRKEDYLHDLPGKQRQPIPVTLDTEQSRVYKELTQELFAMTDEGELIMTPSILALTVRQRQLLVAPQSLGLKTRGAAIDTMIEMAGDLVEDRKPFVVFTPFKTAVPFIADAIKGIFPGTRIFQITGGLTPQQFAEQWQGFQNGSGSRVLICVIKSGSSFHATCADTAFFLGYEWDFNQNAQAEDRLYRIGQKNFVHCYYLMHRGTIDEDIMQKLNDKKYSSDLLLSSDEVYLKLLQKRGRG